MARQQSLISNANKAVAAAATPEKLIAASTLVKSVVIEALPGNTDFVYVGDATYQNHALSPGKAVTIYGDALDHGGQAYLDISSIYIRVAANGEGVSFMYTSGI